MALSRNREIAHRDRAPHHAVFRSVLRIPLAVVAFCAPLTAQVLAPQSPSELVFGEEVDVRVVNLEVVVEDRSGDRVRGLSPEDFRILVDGEEVGVQYFSEVADRRAVTSDGAETPPAVDEERAVVTNYVLFVDDDHTQATLRRPVLRGFGARLDRLGPHDRVAVVVQSRYRLEILSRFTTDRDATRAALAELDSGGRYGGFAGSWAWRNRTKGTVSSTSGDSASSREGASFSGAQNRVNATQAVSLGQVDGPAPPGAISAVGPSAVGVPGSFGRMSEDFVSGWNGLDVADAASRARDLQFSVDAVVSTMRALEAPQGRKVLLLLAGSWPTFERRPGSSGLSGFLRTDPFAAVSSELELLDELIDTANLLGYTVYPMDQQSVRPSTSLWRNLRYVARDTGGKAFMAGSNVKALDKVSFDTSNYYWLGFVPEYQRDDRPHDIRVEVVQPGLRVRSRRGYLDLSRRVEADMEAQRALLFPSDAEPGAGPLLVELGEVETADRRTMRVPVSVYLPVGRFPALPYDGRFRQELEVRFATVDRFGRQAEIPVIPLSLGGGAEPSPDDVVLYETLLTMHRRPHELVVTVHDPLSRLTAAARIPMAP